MQAEHRSMPDAQKRQRPFKLEVDITQVSSSANVAFDQATSKYSKEIQQVVDKATSIKK
jgi:hypothetical protein